MEKLGTKVNAGLHNYATYSLSMTLHVVRYIFVEKLTPSSSSTVPDLPERVLP